MGRPRSLWKHQEGKRGSTVWVEERTPGGNLYVRWRDKAKKQWVWECLNHTDRELAKEHAADLAHAIHTNRHSLATGTLSPLTIFALYEAEVTAHKRGQQPAEDRRRMDVWQAFFARQGIEDVRELDDTVLDEFVRQRRAGTIVVPDRALKPNPTDTTIGADIVFLNSVLNWAHRKRVKGAGGARRRLLPENPVHDYGVLRTKNPRRLWATYDWYLAVREHCSAPSPIDAQGLFGDFLDLMESLGWRVTALCELRRSDFNLTRSEAAPHGLVHKREDTDKEGADEWIPLPLAAREAVDRLLERRKLIGDAYLFPAPKAERAWTRHYVAAVMQRLVERVNAVREAEAEREGREVELLPYVNPHAFRRKWEEERRDLPLKDRMEASSRRDERSLNSSYLRRDLKRVLQVMEEPTKLRGALVLTG